ncbi:MAG: hypothetical protein JSS89_03915 [Bacteroidetes bacterium]|nr:hypothetical protein [Bacteroidota bacterium]
MKPSTKIVWLGYGSVVLSIVWGLPGLACGLYALRLAKATTAAPTPIDPRTRRDIRGGTLLARAGIVLSGIVIAMVLYSWISNAILL